MMGWIIRSISRCLPRSRFVRNVTVLAGGTVVAQAIAVAASPILTRIYSPADFGAFQVFISIMALALVAAPARYEVALLLPEDEQSALNLLAVALLCVGMMSVLLTGIVFVCRFHWFLPASVAILKGHLWLIPISVLAGGLYQVLSYWAMRRESYKQIALSKFTKVGSQVVSQLGIGAAVPGSLGLLIGDAVGRMMGATQFLRVLWRDHRAQIRLIRPARMIRLAIRYRDYPLLSMWGALINASGLALPALFLAQYYGAQETGWFALVGQVLGVPGALIGASIAQVYTSEAAKLSRSDPARLMRVFRETTRQMILLGIVPCILFATLAPWLFAAVFGRTWYEAGEYARYLAVMFYAGFINSPVTMTLNILERQKAQLLWDGSRLVLAVLAMVLPAHLGYGAQVPIISYATAMTMMYAVHWTLSYSAIREATRKFMKEWGRITSALA